MRYYFAPMEGITGHIFRTAHHRFFPGIDQYYSPFVAPNMHHVFSKKELGDVLPENNVGVPLVPQLLAKRAEDILWAAQVLADFGYGEVNLNLGCPSATVVTKGKGAGLLRCPDLLDRTLDEIFSAATVPISIKTRLGIEQPEEFFPLLQVFNRYPIKELIIHPRVQRDFYKNATRLEIFAEAVKQSRNPLCFNGDLVTKDACAGCAARFPQVDALMLGRGLLANPALVQQIQGGAAADKQTLRAFHDEIYAAYSAAFGSARTAMLRMKELWFYLIRSFAESEKYAKKLRKSTRPVEYEAMVDALFQDLPLVLNQESFL